MRYPPDQKAKARKALVDSGARSLKTCGFNGIGVDALAAAAGATSGALYSNFPNKEALLEAVIDACVGEPFLAETESGTRAEQRAKLDRLLDDYISTHHSANPAEGCAMPALSADVSRAQPAVKQVYEHKLTALVERIADLLDGDPSDRTRRAWSTVAMMVGAIVISRGMPDGSESIRLAVESVRRTADTLVATGD
jgi:TetR/AcrR family transcriptional regulator, transcriptional repressor for nem operon